MSYLDELFSVTGKTALVTGAATGIGRMAATALVKAGATVLIASRKGADCEKVAAELNALGAPGQAEGFAGDVSTEAGVAALVAEVKARTQQLDILINNAGTSWGAPFATFPYHGWAKVLERQRHRPVPPDPRAGADAGRRRPATTIRRASSISAR